MHISDYKQNIVRTFTGGGLSYLYSASFSGHSRVPGLLADPVREGRRLGARSVKGKREVLLCLFTRDSSEISGSQKSSLLLNVLESG
jgi:hypothetical protein